MYKYIIIIILLSSIQGWGQVNNIVNDTISTDTIQVEEKKDGMLKLMFMGKPGKAFKYSLLLPGSGQFYNKSYWKIPLVYTAFGVNIYIIDQNRKVYKSFDTAFKMRVDGIPGDEYEGRLSIELLQDYRRNSKKSLQQSYFSLGFIYLLTAIEALVDQHLQSFDVNEDLSLDITPKWQPSMTAGASNTIGISMVFTLK